MSSATEHNKQCVRAFYAALVSADFDTASAMCHGDFVFYGQLDTPRPGAQGFMAAEQGHLDAFAHMTMTVETLVAEGDKVAALVIVEGEHVGEYYGVQPRDGTYVCPCSTCSPSPTGSSSKSAPTTTASTTSSS